MPLLFRRNYTELPPQAAHKASEVAAEVGPSNTDTHDQRAPPSFFGHEEPMTTRACHSWSYYDATTDETAVVTLYAHHSLHVEVWRRSGEASSTNAQRSSSPPWQSEGSYNTDDENQEGLCGHTWELAWLPSPSHSEVGSASPRPASPASARFFLPCTTPLAHSTLKGTGGVVFLSSRHALIATEAAESEQTAMRSTAPPQLLLDSFMVQPLPCNPTKETGVAFSLEPHQWRRVAGSVRLPCPCPAVSMPTAARATPLLVYGVQASSWANCNSNPNGVVIRVLYVAAVSPSLSAGSTNDAVESLFAGVADLCSSPGATLDQEAKLQSVPRHAAMESRVQLYLSLPHCDRSHAHLHVGAAAAPPPPSAALPLRPSNLLWAYVADGERNRRDCARGTQLYGSLVALLPCLRDCTSSAVAAATAASVGAPALSQLLPGLPCTGFSAASLYGVLGTVSDGLDDFAREQVRCLHRSDPNAELSSLAAEEVIAQLLPSAECSVYEVEIGCPVERVQAVSPTMPLPPHTSVLMFVVDGLVARGAVEAEQGLYITRTPPWNEAAGAAAASAAVLRVPLASTLWRGMTPVVLAFAKAARQVDRIATSDTARAPRAASSAVPSPSQANDAEAVHKLSSWALTDVDQWAEYLTEGGGTDQAAEEVDSCPFAAADANEEGGFESEEEAVAFPLLPAAARTPAAAVATTTTVELLAPASSMVSCCLPKMNTLTRELTVWYYVEHNVDGQDPSRGAGTPGPKTPEPADALAIAMAACLPSWCSATPRAKDWEVHVTDWVVSRHLRLSAASFANADAADAWALVSTCSVMKLLWAHALLRTTDPKTAAPKPAWPQMMIDILDSTAADAAQHQTRLCVYARAVQSLVSAGLASSSTATAARREAELTHMHETATVFLRLVLRTLIELDWHAGDAQGRRCAQWMARWFLGEAVGVLSSGSTANDASVKRVVLAEGRAMQVLMQLGAADSVLALLRRMLLLYTCRCRRRPLELTLAEVVEAAGVVLDVAEESAPRSGWSADDDGAPAPAPSPGHPTQERRSEADLVEWRESMEYALLRMAQPEALHHILHSLSYTTNARVVSASMPVKGVLLHGLLSVADLHELVCSGWTPSQIHETAPLGFSFVCLLVDVAMRTTAAAPPSTAEGCERTALDALAAAEREGVVRVPVYPLLSLCGSTSSHERLQSSAAVPFPFSILPPLTTVYVWYHVVDRLCRALKLLPWQSSAPQGEDTQHGDEDEEDLAAWSKRGRADASLLGGLHRGLCVLRCLTQRSPRCAEEMFAAMQLVYTPPLGAYCGWGEVAGAGASEDDAASSSWGWQYLVAWQHLLSLEAPPLSEQGAATAYRERCLSLSTHFAGLMRVLHLVYASAGSGHVLRAQLWRATTGPEVKQTDSTQRDDHARSLVQLEHSLSGWLTAARQSNSTTHAALPNQTKDLPTSPDLVAPWLTHILAHTVLCDPAAVTDVGMYEQVYTALAHAKQQISSMAATAAHPLNGSVPLPAAANIAFAVLRPFMMYAYPVLRQLALAEELMGTTQGGLTQHGQNAEENAGSEADACAGRLFLQFNEPLVWPRAAEKMLGSPPPEQELEQLCAGEVCERVRRQLARLVGLYEAPTGTSTNSSGAGDPRFRVLAALLSLQPSVVDIAVRQRRLTRSSAAASQRWHAAQKNAPAGERAALTTPPLEPTTAAHSAATSRSSSGGSEADAEGTLELMHFHLSPVASYVTAASAIAVGGGSGAPDAFSKHGLQQQQQLSSPRHLGWFTVGCEVIRRELHTYVVTELLLSQYITITDAAQPLEVAWKGEGRLLATEKQLKAFINALADAVEPLTLALVKGFRSSLYHSVVLLLLFNTLHQLFFAEAEAATQREGAAGPVRPPAAPICTDASRSQLFKQWIRQVATPLYRNLAVEDQETALHVLTSSFITEYLSGIEKRESNSNNNDNRDAEQRQPKQPAQAEGRLSAYLKSDLHHTWQQWRQQGGAALTPASAKVEAAVVGCLEHGVAEDCRSLLHLSPPYGALPGAAHSVGPCAAPAAPRGQRRESLPGNSRNGGGGGTSWMEAGSALRSSLLQTIGATVASRPGQQTGSAPTPKPALVVADQKVLSAGQILTEAAAGRNGGAASATAAVEAVPPCASREAEEVIQLLCKEESFLRRQLVRQLLEELRQDFLASPALQRELMGLYLVLRAEKRRRELVSFALDQHDLIFAFASREQHLLHVHCCRQLRQASVEYGERQRLILRRLLQEERGIRMGVEAMAYADRAYLHEAERAEAKTWILQEEGRRGIALHEQDAWDALSVAAARALVEITRRAVEAEEEAYWRAEEEEWARMEEEEREGAAGKTSSAAPKTAEIKRCGRLEEGRVKPTMPRGVQETLKTGAVRSAHLHSAAAAPSLHLTDPHVQQCGESMVETEKESEPYPQTGLARAVAQTAAEVSASSLLGALSRWQTALRETVAPAPATRRAELGGKGAEALRATVSWKGTSVAPLPAPQPRVVATVTHTEKTAEFEAKKGSGWGWASESSNEDVVEREPMESDALTKAPTSAASQKATSVVHAKQQTPSSATPPVKLLNSHRILPLHAAPHAPQHGSADTTAGSTQAHPHSSKHPSSMEPASKPRRSRKGFGAARIVEPISSTSAAAALPSRPPAGREQQLPLSPATQQQRGGKQTLCSSMPEDATPNPVRSILSAVEAAATETISTVRQDAHPALSSPALPAVLRSASEEEGARMQLSRNHLAATAGTLVAQDDCRTAAAAGKPKAPRKEAPAQADGWRADSSASANQTATEGVEAPLPAAPSAEPPKDNNKPEEPSAQPMPMEGNPASAAAPVKAAYAEAEAEDDGWGWSDEDDEMQPTTDAQLSVQEVQKAALLTSLRGGASPPHPSVALAILAAASATATAEESNRAPSAAVNEAPLVTERSGPSGWSSHDKDSVGSSTAPVQSTASVVLPPSLSGGIKEFTDLQLQQLYLRELEIREKMLNFL
ncbi:hypothetical protein ABL78_7052 [Leptomonas seymouri]|uniref:Uncharacterized protein n=1 Tax=Leptomonas seymouri TaxID=5684 RepID=A0A0N1HUI6_LEPSE|nr:hypothetical protein ABL78_7052 [Leptomonas seymouri]|eukprot:KPI83903.1 hypothetical protein ABL78_7052 [Leptomonas seymouri]